MTVISPRPAPEGAADAAAAAGGFARVLRLRRGVEVVADPAALVAGVADTVLLGHPWGRMRLRGLGEDVAAALVTMAADGCAVRGGPDGGPVAARVHALLTASVPFVARTDVEGATGLLLAVEPVSASARPLASPVLSPATEVVLPRHAYVRRADADSGWSASVLESPTALHRAVLVEARVAGLVAAFGARTPIADAAVSAGLPEAVALEVASVLAAAGLLAVGEEREDDATSLWGFHELLFHGLSRPGRHDHVTGGVYAHRDVPSPAALPAIAVVPDASPSSAGHAVDLPVPSFDDVVAADPPFTAVLEGRRSVRRHERPLTVAALGEFLYRAARARRVLPAPDSPTGQAGVDRPYPMGGGLGELELCLAVRACDGLEPGAYRHDSAAHRLVRLDARQADVDTLLAGAVRATNGLGDPQVLVTVTSRVGRLTWKYSQIGYALTLKHVGCLYQTGYLVAAAMGLGMCALGSGDVEAAGRAYGLSWPAETPVGEFLLGGGLLEPAAVEGFTDVVDAWR
ncbi:MAG: SagB family peptide dehydrogenase [Kineosporiaceae bacterium]